MLTSGTVSCLPQIIGSTSGTWLLGIITVASLAAPLPETCNGHLSPLSPRLNLLSSWRLHLPLLLIRASPLFFSLIKDCDDSSTSPLLLLRYTPHGRILELQSNASIRNSVVVMLLFGWLLHFLLRECIGLSRHRWLGCIHIGSSTCLRP